MCNISVNVIYCAALPTMFVTSCGLKWGKYHFHNKIKLAQLTVNNKSLDILGLKCKNLLSHTTEIDSLKKLAIKWAIWTPLGMQWDQESLGSWLLELQLQVCVCGWYKSYFPVGRRMSLGFWKWRTMASRAPYCPGGAIWASHKQPNYPTHFPLLHWLCERMSVSLWTATSNALHADGVRVDTCALNPVLCLSSDVVCMCVWARAKLMSFAALYPTPEQTQVLAGTAQMDTLTLHSF